jgi:hypothetical protein
MLLIKLVLTNESHRKDCIIFEAKFRILFKKGKMIISLCESIMKCEYLHGEQLSSFSFCFNMYAY